MPKKKKKFKITFFSEFRQFINRGNVLNLAIAVVIGAAFGKITTSLVNDIIMPLISLAIGGLSFSDLKWVIKEAEYDAVGTLITSETAVRYGNFIQASIDFLLIALCIFIAIKIMAMAQRKLHAIAKKEQEKEEIVQEEVVAPQPTVQELLTSIILILKNLEDNQTQQNKVN